MIAQPTTIRRAMAAAELEREAWHSLLESLHCNPYKLAEKKSTYDRWHKRLCAKRQRCLEACNETG